MPNESCPLKWEFCSGTWTAASQVMDPVMTDEEPSTWCREWCLQWVIYVDEEGYFCIDQSDRQLLSAADHIRVARLFCKQLDFVTSKVDLLENELRQQGELSSGEKIVLLNKEIYCR